MKYCTRCKKIFRSEDIQNCTVCSRKLIDDPNQYSPVDIVTANGFELERIKAALTDSKIPFTVQETEKDTGIQILNSAPPENCTIRVPLGYYTEASELLIGIGALNEAEELSDEDEAKLQEERKKESLLPETPAKRFLSYVMFIIFFILMIAAVIFITDLITPFINPYYS